MQSFVTEKFVLNNVTKRKAKLVVGKVSSLFVVKYVQKKTN
jgi:hypothetical protein